MDQDKKIEQLVLTCIDTAKAMLDEYGLVVPFGIRSFNDSNDLKMNCPADKNPEDNMDLQVDYIVAELKEFVVNEDVFATALVTDLEAGDEKGVGLQIETAMSSVLFVYPYVKDNDEWLISDPIQTDQLLVTVFPGS
ncbi:MAG: hypothetical protein GXP22_01630 [Gammaproteobacteria bacterium]|nr:hypothetical protein [Gammaproteobacteria bacterium]